MCIITISFHNQIKEEGRVPSNLLSVLYTIRKHEVTYFILALTQCCMICERKHVPVLFMCLQPCSTSLILFCAVSPTLRSAHPFTATFHIETKRNDFITSKVHNSTNTSHVAFWVNSTIVTFSVQVNLVKALFYYQYFFCLLPMPQVSAGCVGESKVEGKYHSYKGKYVVSLITDC